MRQTSRGRVTEEHLAYLEEWAGRYPRPWTMGVSTAVMTALITELRALRAQVREREDLERWTSEGGR